MNLAALILYTRDLTGIYSTDVVPDSLVTRWLNESYFELQRRSTWPWTATELSTNTDVPAFDAQFHAILAYRTAIKILNFTSDDTSRAEGYSIEAGGLLADMERYYLSGEATGSYATAGALVRLTRDLTGVYDADTISDALLLRWVNDAQLELARQRTWPWSGSVTVMSPSDAPAFSSSSNAQFNHILAYRAAARVALMLGDEGGRMEQFGGEYNALLSDMERFFLAAAATGATNNVSAMTRMVRDLTGIYSNQSLPDSLILVYLNNAYNELSRRHDWDWLEATHEVPLPAPAGGAHQLSLPNGTRRIMEAYIVFKNGDVQEMVNVPNLARIEVNDSNIYYDVDYGGNVVIRPVQSDNEATLKFRYLRANVDLVTGTDVPSFDTSFRLILPYRAAVTVLSQFSPNDPRIESYEAEFMSLYQGMYTMYELVHDNRSFQLNEDGTRTRRYYPWFRPS
jgi:hypothetical protein